MRGFKTIFLAVALAAALVIAVPVYAQQITIGYTPSDWDPADFHGLFGAGIELGLQELGIEYEMIIRAAGDHTAHEEQLSIAEDFIAEGVDYIVINPTDYDVQQRTYEVVLESGIPLIVGNFNIPFPEEWGIGQPMLLSGYSHEDAGLMMADYLVEHYPEGTNIAVISAAPGRVSDARGQLELHEANGFNIVYQEYAYAERMRSYDTMERIITAYPETEVVLALSSMMAVGAVEAVEAAGMRGQFDIYGAGGTLEELIAIEEGKLAGAWKRDEIAMGKAVAETIQLHMQGREDEIEPIFNSPIVMIDSVEAINEHVPAVIYTEAGYEFPRPLP